MIKFISETDIKHSQYTAVERIEVQCDSESTILELRQAFNDFLKACGFQISELDQKEEE